VDSEYRGECFAEGAEVWLLVEGETISVERIRIATFFGFVSAGGGGSGGGGFCG